MINSYSEHKRYLIMNIVNHMGAVSRTDLANLTGFQLASITAITKQLIADNILVETGSYSVGHGRSRTLLRLNSAYLCAISISFTPSAVTCITAQFDGTIIDKKTSDISGVPSRSSVCDTVCGLIRNALDTYRERCVIGVGICTPSNDPARYPIFTFDSSFRHMRDWILNALLPYLRDAFSIPIEMYNDVSLATLAEQNFGAARGLRDFICIELSNGIGCSICCNGKYVAGSNGEAGELGHTIVDLSNPDKSLCYCGKPGCVEHYASLPDLLQKITAALDNRVHSMLQKETGGSPLSIDSIRSACDSGDRMCRYYIRLTAQHLGAAIANVIMLLAPQRIILYGHMLQLGDYFLEQLKLSISENISTTFNFDPSAVVVSPELVEKLPLVAISEIFFAYLKKEDFNWVYQLPQIAQAETT